MVIEIFDRLHEIPPYEKDAREIAIDWVPVRRKPHPSRPSQRQS
jgi:hypothetical protein